MVSCFVLNRSQPRSHSFHFAGTRLVVAFLRRYFFSKSFPIISFADPHLLISLESCRFKKGAGRGHSRHPNPLPPKPLRFNPFADPHPLTPVVSIFYKNSGGMGHYVRSCIGTLQSKTECSLCPSPQPRFGV